MLAFCSKLIGGACVFSHTRERVYNNAFYKKLKFIKLKYSQRSFFGPLFLLFTLMTFQIILENALKKIYIHVKSFEALIRHLKELLMTYSYNFEIWIYLQNAFPC